MLEQWQLSRQRGPPRCFAQEVVVRAARRQGGRITVDRKVIKPRRISWREGPAVHDRRRIDGNEDRPVVGRVSAKGRHRRHAPAAIHRHEERDDRQGQQRRQRPATGASPGFLWQPRYGGLGRDNVRLSGHQNPAPRMAALSTWALSRKPAFSFSFIGTGRGGPALPIATSRGRLRQTSLTPSKPSASVISPDTGNTRAVSSNRASRISATHSPIAKLVAPLPATIWAAALRVCWVISLRARTSSLPCPMTAQSRRGTVPTAALLQRGSSLSPCSPAM